MEFASAEPDYLPIVDFKPDASMRLDGDGVVAEAKFPTSENTNLIEITGFRTGDLCFS